MLRGVIQNHKAAWPQIEMKKNRFFTTLVVVDQAQLEPALETYMKVEGHSFLVASNEGEALACTQELQPDLILIDSHLDGKSTLTLLPRLFMEQPGAAVIILASAPSISEAVAGIKLGATEYFERPLDMAKLKRAIDIQKALFND